VCARERFCVGKWVWLRFCVRVREKGRERKQFRQSVCVLVLGSFFVLVHVRVRVRV